jgi:Serine dehydrogenase proteinase
MGNLSVNTSPNEDRRKNDPPFEDFPRGKTHPNTSPLFWVENKDRYLRQLLIRDIEAETTIPLCVYFASSEMPSRITQEDVGRLYEIVKPYRGEKFDLLIETAGGATDAAEALVSMLRSLKSRFRVIVPNRAKSNGTLICLAAYQIVMGITSELGPIEPAVSGIPSNILVLQEYATRAFSLHKLGTFALDQTRKLAEQLLLTGMLDGKTQAEVSKIVDQLCSRKFYPSHGSVINHEEAGKLGFNVEYLDAGSTLWDKFWLLYCMYMFDSKTRGLSKIFEQRKFSHSVIGPEDVLEDESEI